VSFSRLTDQNVKIKIFGFVKIIFVLVYGISYLCFILYSIYGSSIHNHQLSWPSVERDCDSNFNPLTPTVAIWDFMGTAIKHTVPDRVKPS